MIFAAGLGTRLKPLTDTMPKALVPVGGRPLLDLIINRLREQGYDRFVVNIHHFAQMIKDLNLKATKYNNNMEEFNTNTDIDITSIADMFKDDLTI